MPALIERRKMTRATYQALKRHILKEREKRKQEKVSTAENDIFICLVIPMEGENHSLFWQIKMNFALPLFSA